MAALGRVREEAHKTRVQDDAAHGRIDAALETLAEGVTVLTQHLHGQPGRPGLLQIVSIIQTKVAVGVWVLGVVAAALVAGVVGLFWEMIPPKP